jgi:PHD/YefM family antitoxin component YafN of YafNO toxin-antitoxin module
MEKITVGQFRDNFFGKINEVIRSNEPIEVSTDYGSVILVSKEYWIYIQKALTQKRGVSQR